MPPIGSRDAKIRKQAMKLLKGDDDIAEDIIDSVMDVVTDLLKK